MATRLGDLVRHLPARMRLEGTGKQTMEVLSLYTHLTLPTN